MSYNFKKDIKPIWCPGCGLHIIYRAMIKTFKNFGWTNKDVAVISGIGCTGRGAGYFNLDTAHTTHGRSLCVAEGLKLGNPDLNVVVLSGDGDLFGIGGNHLLHVARRNTNITVICNSNKIYGMTGGQMSPETPKGAVTATTPKGAPYNPIHSQKIVTANDDYFYGRASITDMKQMQEILTEAINWQGFSFVNVQSICPTNYGRRAGFKNASEMMQVLDERITKQTNPEILEENQLGFVHS